MRIIDNILTNRVKVIILIKIIMSIINKIPNKECSIWSAGNPLTRHSIEYTKTINKIIDRLNQNSKHTKNSSINNKYQRKPNKKYQTY